MAADPAFQPLDLRAAANRGFTDREGVGGWTDQADNDLRGMTAGPCTAGGIPFTVIDPAGNQGRSVVALRADQAPTFLATAAIPLGRTAGAVYLLHSAAWARTGNPAGTVAWRYQDGSEALSTVTTGDEVGDWWGGAAERAALLSLRGVNPKRSPVYLFATSFANPHPGRVVERLELRAGGAGNRAIWLVLAATVAERADLIAGIEPKPRDLAGWQPFRLGFSIPAAPLLDLSHLLDAPAGRHGFVQVKDGHFAFADGTPARFWGTNIHASDGFRASREQAGRCAATLARWGVNLVRLHLPETALRDNARPAEPPRPDAPGWAGFDELVAAFKARGIYVLIDSLTGLSGRKFADLAADGVGKDYEPHRPWAYWDQRLHDLARSWAAAVLDHVNPRTGLAVKDEPAVALTLLINEQAAFWDMHPGKPVPPAQDQALRRLYNAWLVKRHRDRAGLAAAWGGCLGADEDPAAGSVRVSPLESLPVRGETPALKDPRRVADTTRFLAEVQQAWNAGLLAFVRGRGCRIPVGGTNIVHSPAELATHRGMGFTSQNVYYDHVAAGREGRWFSANLPAVERDLLADNRTLETPIAAVKIAGVPVTSTETGSMWPHEWRASHFPLLAATAAHQDWDAILHYNLIGGFGLSFDDADRAQAILKPTVEFNDPALIGALPAAALLFHRRDVAPGRALVQVTVDEAAADSRGSLIGGGFPWNYLTHVARVETVFGPAAAGAASVASGQAGEAAALARDLDRRLKADGVLAAGRGLDGSALVSDTGEVRRDWGRCLATIDTARTQGFTGFPRGEVRLRDVAIACDTPFATVLASSLDGAPLATSRRVLLTAVARAWNQGDVVRHGETAANAAGAVRGERQTLLPGAGAVLIEPVRARVALPGAGWRCTALAPDGSAAAPVAVAPGGPLPLGGGPGTVWYVAER
ncbi:MAG: hypothetical protein L6R48_13145 [Planctomycetes bacterium]|nr:hypothetical protein [Planctomycetota bacterium]